MPNYEAVRESLFQLDPMHTGCVENNATDEYDGLARSICARMDQSESLEQALRDVFDNAFWPGALSPESVATCVQAIRGAN